MRIQLGKTSIVTFLYHIIKCVWYVNLVLGISAITYQVLNIVYNKKLLMAQYLGQFNVNIKSSAVVEFANSNLPAGISTFKGSPVLILPNKINTCLILIYTIAVVTIILFYNYKFYKIFYSLYNLSKKNNAFDNLIPHYLKQLSVFSIIVFFIGSILSIIKIMYINQITVNNIILSPAYDNGLLNFLWASLLFAVLTLIFKIGHNLKTDNELTI